MKYIVASSAVSLAGLLAFTAALVLASEDQSKALLDAIAVWGLFIGLFGAVGLVAAISEYFDR